jgi:hypothetical protein
VRELRPNNKNKANSALMKLIVAINHFARSVCGTALNSMLRWWNIMLGFLPQRRIALTDAKMSGI